MYKSLLPTQSGARLVRPGHNWRVCAASAAVALLSATPALAQREDEDVAVNEFEITPFGGYTVGGEFEDPNDDSERDLNSDVSFGVILGYTTEDPTRHYELYYSNQPTDVEGTSELDLDVQYLHIGGALDFPQDNRRAIPFVAGGLGATLLSPDRTGFDDETEFSLSLGGGLKIPLSQSISLRFDARAFVTFLDSDTSVFCVSAPPTAACDIRAKSDSFVQFSTSLGITAGF
jgi:opacity protein-like surface antigen